jgi:hypothetical protein
VQKNQERLKNKYMNLKISKLYSTFYILPALRIWHERTYEEELCNLSIEILWFNRALELILIDK